MGQASVSAEGSAGAVSSAVGRVRASQSAMTSASSCAEQAVRVGNAGLGDPMDRDPDRVRGGVAPEAAGRDTCLADERPGPGRGRRGGVEGLAAVLLESCRPAGRRARRARCRRSARKRPVRSAARRQATGSAVVAARSAIRASIRTSSLVRPTTEGIRTASSCRWPSEVQSLTSRASSPSRGWVHRGWSLQRSPASTEAISMKQAPLRLLRCLPRDSIGMASGAEVEGPVMGTPTSRSGSRASLPLGGRFRQTLIHGSAVASKPASVLVRAEGGPCASRPSLLASVRVIEPGATPRPATDVPPPPGTDVPTPPAVGAPRECPLQGRPHRPPSRLQRHRRSARTPPPHRRR